MNYLIIFTNPFEMFVFFKRYFQLLHNPYRWCSSSASSSYKNTYIIFKISWQQHVQLLRFIHFWWLLMIDGITLLHIRNFFLFQWTIRPIWKLKLVQLRIYGKIVYSFESYWNHCQQQQSHHKWKAIEMAFAHLAFTTFCIVWDISISNFTWFSVYISLNITGQCFFFAKLFWLNKINRERERERVYIFLFSQFHEFISNSQCG